MGHIYLHTDIIMAQMHLTMIYDYIVYVFEVDSVGKRIG